MLASDGNNPNFVGAHNPDSLNYVKFYLATFQNNFRTEKEGKPVFEQEVRVFIQGPGNQLNIPHHRATDEHKQRYPFQWQQFVNSQGPGEVAGVEGMPIDEWPAMTRSRAEELRAQKFFTVEQIANASDAQLQAIGMDGRMLQQKARALLAAAKDSALAQQQAVELMRKDQKISDLEENQKRMAAQIEQLLAAQSAKSQQTISLKK